MTTDSVQTFLERHRQEIPTLVEEAYTHRAREHLTPNGLTTFESIKATQETVAILMAHREDDIQLTPNTGDQSLITTKSSHVYALYVEEALTRLAEDNYFERDKIPSTVAMILEHEHGHTIPILGDPRVLIYYGIQFIEDPDRLYRGIRPFITFDGVATGNTIIEVLRATPTPSQTDLIVGKAFA